MRRRTVREFPRPKHLWNQVDAWAEENGFELKEEEGGRRLYRKGHWMLMAPAFVEVRQEGKQAVFEAWVKADIFLILSLLAGRKPEAAVDSGGLTAALPRRLAREAFNKLLARFDQKPVS